MLDFYEKRKLRNILYSKAILSILGILILLLLYSVWGVYEKERETRVKKSQRVEILDELRGRETLLQNEVDRLSTERGIEEELRSKFEVAREGEEVIVIVDAPEDEIVIPVAEPLGIFERILNIFR